MRRRGARGKGPLVAVVMTLALGLMPAMAPAQVTGCAHTTTAADAAPASHIRAALRCLVNAARTQRGLPTLRGSARLRLAAGRHSVDMVRRHYFEHVSPDGRSLADRVRLTGYLRSAHRWALGENIGWGTGTAATPAAMIRSWMNSPPHRAVILDRRFREVGLGVARGVPVAAGGDGATFVLNAGVVR